MAHRTFTDRFGLAWEVWDVIPAAAERRAGVERRESTRALDDRRESHNYWIGVRHELANGWLCFQSGREKRRLAPIPDDWDRLPEQALLELLDTARPTPETHSRSV